ncbi:nucleotide hydrolase [Malassezia pachydermatis]
MDAVAAAWNLTQLYGLVPRDYFLDRVPYGDKEALLTLLGEQVLPMVVRPANPRHKHTPTLVLINSGSQRFDVLAGPFTKNDQCTWHRDLRQTLSAPSATTFCLSRMCHGAPPSSWSVV